MNRQLFLIEQGYTYDVREWKDYVVNGPTAVTAPEVTPEVPSEAAAAE